MSVLIFSGCQSNSTTDEAHASIIPTTFEENKKVEEQKPLTEQELKQQLYVTECKDPAKYLSGNFTSTIIYKNVLSLKVKGLKLKFNIANAATIVTFKDPKVKVKFLAKTGAVVKEKTFNLYDFIGPNRSMTYKVEMEMTNQEYKDYSTASMEILSANHQ